MGRAEWQKRRSTGQPKRGMPTLLIDVEPFVGLTREMVNQLLEWARFVGEDAEAAGHT